MNKTKTSAYRIWFLISTTYYIYINHKPRIDYEYWRGFPGGGKVLTYYTSGRNKLFRKVDAHANKRLHDYLGVKSFKMIVFCILKLNLFTFLGLAHTDNDEIHLTWSWLNDFTPQFLWKCPFSWASTFLNNLFLPGVN